MLLFNFLKRFVAQRRSALVLFAAIWLIVLCVPALRLMLHVQLRGSNLIQYNAPWPQPQHDEFNMQALAKLHPNDVRVLEKEVEAHNYSPANPQDNWRRKQTEAFDRLIARFPNNAWLVATRLRFTRSWFSDNRLAGDLEDTRLLLRRGPAPEHTKEPPSFTKADANQAIRMAQLGRRLEPDNCYFDWMLAMFLMSDHRDAQALRVLKEGARKPRYDDHILEDTRITIQVHEMVRPLLIEEKLRISASAQYWHLRGFRHLSRLIAWHAWKLESHGEHERSIPIYRDLALMAAPMMRKPNDIFANVGAGLQAIAWGSNSPQRRVTDKELGARGAQSGTEVGNRLRGLLLARRFADYAASHGEHETARETLQLAQQTAQTWHLYFKAEKLKMWFGVPPRTQDALFGLWFFALFSLLQIPLMLVMCGVLSTALLFTRPALVTKGEVMRSTAFATVLALGITAFTLYLMMGTSFWSDYGDEWEWLAKGCFVFWASPIFSSAAICCWGMSLFMHRNRKELTPPPRYEGDSARYLVPPDYLPVAINLCFAVIVAATLGCWIAAAIAGIAYEAGWTFIPNSHRAEDYATTASVATVVVYVGWIIKWRWYAPAHLRPLQHAALHRHRRTLGVFIVVSAAFYLLFSLASLLPRRAAEEAFSEYLRNGDIALLQSR